MKVATIFLLAMALTLCYCWTADGHNDAGLRNDKTGLQKMNHNRGHHLGNIASNLGERRYVQCKCVRRNPHELQRKRRHMNKPLKRNPHGRRCHCKKRRGNSELSIPLS